MFTNEIEFDETITTIMDETAQLEDVKIFIDDNEVYFRQWSEELQEHQIVILSHQMFKEFLEALNKSEGMYKIL